jgi:hypothetical protein
MFSNGDVVKVLVADFGPSKLIKRGMTLICSDGFNYDGWVTDGKFVKTEWASCYAFKFEKVKSPQPTIDSCIDIVNDPWYIVIKGESHLRNVLSWLKEGYNMYPVWSVGGFGGLASIPRVVTNRFVDGKSDGYLKHCNTIQGVFPPCVKLELDFETKPTLQSFKVHPSIDDEEITELQKLIDVAKARIEELSKNR